MVMTCDYWMWALTFTPKHAHKTGGSGGEGLWLGVGCQLSGIWQGGEIVGGCICTSIIYTVDKNWNCALTSITSVFYWNRARGKSSALLHLHVHYELILKNCCFFKKSLSSRGSFPGRLIAPKTLVFPPPYRLQTQKTSTENGLSLTAGKPITEPWGAVLMMTWVKTLHTTLKQLLPLQKVLCVCVIL